MNDKKQGDPLRCGCRPVLAAFGLATLMSLLGVGVGRLVEMGEGLVGLVLGVLVVELIGWRIHRPIERIAVTLLILLYSGGLAALLHQALCQLPMARSVRPEHCHTGAVVATVIFILLGPVLGLAAMEVGTALAKQGRRTHEELSDFNE